MLEKLKKYKGRLMVLIIFLIVGIPLVIHTAYKIDSGVTFFVAEWTAGELLLYYAAVLTFVSTTFLSVIALQYTIFFKKNDDMASNKITACLTKSSDIEFEYKGNIGCIIEIMFDNLCDSFPEFAIVKRVGVYQVLRNKKIEIPCNRKNFCPVRNLNRENFIIEMYFMESPTNLIDIANNKRILKNYKSGLITSEEAFLESKYTIKFDIGVCKDGVVTPFDVKLHLGLDAQKSIKFSDYFRYMIEDAELYIGSAILYEDYERTLLE